MGHAEEFLVISSFFSVHESSKLNYDGSFCEILIIILSVEEDDVFFFFQRSFDLIYGQ